MNETGVINKANMSKKISVGSLDKRKTADLTANIGIALSIVGVPLGMYCNFLFPVVQWSPVFMVVSVLLIISYSNIRSLKFPSFNKLFLYVLIFQILMLFYGILSDNMTSQYLSFHLYIISLIVSLSTLDLKKNYDNIILWTFLVSGICSVLGAYFLFKGLVIGEDAWHMRQDNENYALEAFTVTVGAIANLAASICLIEKKKNIIRLILLIFIALDAYTILFSGKRTPVFVSLAMILFYFYKSGGLSSGKFGRYIGIFIIVIVLCAILYLNIIPFQEAVDNFAYNFYIGVLNIFGDTTVLDASGSGIARYQARIWASDYIDHNFSLLNYVIGGGYMTRWLDNPIFQSYLDLGILGVLLYVYLIILLPIRTIFVIKRMDALVMFSLMLCFYNILSAINSGNEYMFSKYVPLVILAFFINPKFLYFNKYRKNIVVDQLL